MGNRPTKASIERFKGYFGDDYLAFWANGTYNIVLNSGLFSDPTGAEDLYQDQLTWLEERLKYSTAKNAEFVFVFSHHPWFLYSEDEEAADLQGYTDKIIDNGTVEKIPFQIHGITMPIG